MKKGKLKKEVADDSFDFDSDLDLGDFDFNVPEMKDNRKPVTKVMSGAWDGVKSTVRSTSFIKKTLKDVFPIGFGQTLDLAENTTSKIKDLYDESVKEVKPAIKDFKRVVTKLIPSDSKILPKSVSELLKRWQEEKKEDEAINKGDQRESMLSMHLQDIFEQQTIAAQRDKAEQQASDYVDKGVELNRHRDVFGLLNVSNSLLSRISQYQTTINLGFQKKTLELGYRQLFALQDLVALGNRQSLLEATVLPAIQKNTGLPDYVKETSLEFAKEIQKRKFIEGATSALFGDTGDYLKKILGTLGANLKEKVKTGASNFREGLMGAESVHEQTDGMEGIDKHNVAGNVVGSAITEGVGSKAGKWLHEKFVKGSPKLQKAGHKLESFVGNAPRKINEFRTGDAGDYDSGIKGWAIRTIKELLPSPGIETKFDAKPSLKDLDTTARFTGRVSKSITDIIPGYLARILRELQVTRTGNDKIELTEFDLSGDKFTSKTKLVSSILKKVINPEKLKQTQSKFDDIFKVIDPEGKLSKEAKLALRSKLMHNSVGMREASVANLGQGHTYTGKGGQEAGDHMFDFLSGLNEEQKLHFEKLHNSLSSSISDPRATMEEMIKAGQGKHLAATGLYDHKTNDLNIEKLMEMYSAEAKPADAIKAASTSHSNPSETKVPKRQYKPTIKTEPPKEIPVKNKLINFAGDAADHVKELLRAKTPAIKPKVSYKDFKKTLDEKNIQHQPIKETSILGDKLDTIIKQITKITSLLKSHTAKVKIPTVNISDKVAEAKAIIQPHLENAKKVIERKKPHYKLKLKAAKESVVEAIHNPHTAIATTKESLAKIHDTVKADPRVQAGLGIIETGLDKAKVKYTSIKDKLTSPEIEAKIAEAKETIAKQIQTAKEFTAQQIEAAKAAVKPHIESAKEKIAPHVKAMQHQYTKQKKRVTDKVEEIKALPHRGEKPKPEVKSTGLDEHKSDLKEFLEVKLDEIVNNTQSTSGYLKSIEELIKAGNFGTGNGTGPISETSPRFGSGLFGSIAGVAYHSAKGVGKVASAIGSTFMASARLNGKILSRVGNAILSSTSKDVYIEGEDKPRLYEARMGSGAYIRKSDGKPVKSLGDIDGAILDAEGNIIITAEEVGKLYVKTKRGIVTKLFKTGTRIIGAAGSGIFNFAKVAIPAAFNAELAIAKFGFKMAKSVVTGLWNLLDRPIDLYVPGFKDPVLLAVVMKNGGYFSKLTKKAILKPGNIDGAIVDVDGNEVLSLDMLRKGLTDINGKKLKLPLQKILSFFTGGITSLAKGVWAVQKKAWQATKVIAGGMAKVGKGILGVGKNILLGKGALHGLTTPGANAAESTGSTEAVSLLTEIKDILVSHFKESESKAPTRKTKQSRRQKAAQKRSTATTGPIPEAAKPTTDLHDKLKEHGAQVGKAAGSAKSSILGLFNKTKAKLQEYVTPEKADKAKSVIQKQIGSAKDKTKELKAAIFSDKNKERLTTAKNTAVDLASNAKNIITRSVPALPAVAPVATAVTPAPVQQPIAPVIPQAPAPAPAADAGATTTTVSTGLSSLASAAGKGGKFGKIMSVVGKVGSAVGSGLSMVGNALSGPAPVQAAPPSVVPPQAKQTTEDTSEPSPITNSTLVKKAETVSKPKSLIPNKALESLPPEEGAMIKSEEGLVDSESKMTAKIGELVETMKPKEAALGDDGHGFRKGSWQDKQLKNRSGVASATTVTPQSSLPNKVNPMAAAGAGAAAGGVGDLVGKIGDLISGVKDVFSLGKAGGNMLSKLAKVGGRGASLLGESAMAAEGAVAAGSSAAAAGGAAVAGEAGAATAAAAALGTEGAAVAGAAAVGAEGVAAGAAGAGALGVIGSTLGAIGSGLLAFVSSPVVLAAAAVAAVGYVGYKTYKHFKNKLSPLEKIRYVQYGFDANDDKYSGNMFDLESYISGFTQASDDNITVKEKDLDVKKLLGFFDLDSSNKDHLQRFFKWYQNRFKPVYLTHLTALSKVAKTTDLDKINGLKDEVKKAYLDIAKFPDGPYGYGNMPMLDKDYKVSGSKEVTAVITSVIAELKLDKVNGKPLSSVGDTYNTKDPAAAGATDKPNVEDTEGMTDSDVQQRLKNGPSKGSASNLNVTGAASNAGKAGDSKLSALDSVRFKAYGLTELTADKVKAMRLLETEAAKSVKFTTGNPATWNGDYMKVLKNLMGNFSIFNIVGKEATDWFLWFTKRFLPIYLNYVTAYLGYTGKKDFDPANIAELSAQQNLDLAKALGGTNGIWSISNSPFPEYKVNTDSDSIKENIIFLETTVKEVKLQEERKPTTAPSAPSTNVAPTDTTKPNNAGGALDGKVLAPSKDSGPDGESKPTLTATIAPADAKANPSGLKLASGELLDGRNGAASMNIAPGVKTQQINPAFMKQFNGMVEEYNKITGKKVTVTDGYRSYEDQVAMKKKYGDRAATPGKSLHEFGLAMDVDSKDVSAMDDLGLMRKYGFIRPVGGEPWHVEPAGIQLNIDKYKADSSAAEQAIVSGVGRGGGGNGTVAGARPYSRDRDLSEKIISSKISPNVDIAKAGDSGKSDIPPADGTKPAVPGATTATSASATPDVSGTTKTALPTDPSAAKPNALTTSPDGESNPKATGTADSATGKAAPTRKIAVNPSSGNGGYAGSANATKSSSLDGGNKFDKMPSDPSVKVPDPKAGDVNSIKDTVVAAAKMVGVDPNTAVSTVAIESGFKPNAKAGTSSASGLYQFTSGTWNEMIKKHGSTYGIGADAVPTDPKAAAIMGASYLKDNIKAIGGKTSHPVGPTEAYIGHFLGAGGAGTFLNAVDKNPDATGAGIMPKAAESNKPIFFNGGAPRSVAQIYDLLDHKVKTKAAQFGVTLADTDSAKSGAKASSDSSGADASTDTAEGATSAAKPTTTAASDSPTDNTTATGVTATSSSENVAAAPLKAAPDNKISAAPTSTPATQSAPTVTIATKATQSNVIPITTKSAQSTPERGSQKAGLLGALNSFIGKSPQLPNDNAARPSSRSNAPTDTNTKINKVATTAASLFGDMGRSPMSDAYGFNPAMIQNNAQDNAANTNQNMFNGDVMKTTEGLLTQSLDIEKQVLAVLKDIFTAVSSDDKDDGSKDPDIGKMSKPVDNSLRSASGISYSAPTTAVSMKKTA